MKEKYQKLIRNLRFYHENLTLFEQQYPGKYLLIWDEMLAGVYPSYEEAVEQASNEFESGTYLLKQCQPETKGQKGYAVKNGIAQAVTSVRV